MNTGPSTHVVEKDSPTREASCGLADASEEVAQPHLAKGRLKRVLEDWRPPYSGYHLYDPSRRQSSAAFSLLVDAL